jgi:nicotinamide-nucleotide amidase
MRLQGGYSVEIIATGDEILLGRIVDTNSSWIERRAAELGAPVRRVTCVGDDVNEIASVLQEALTRRNDLIIFTGGLGPSEDDLTVEAIGRVVGRKVVLDEESVERIRRGYAERGVRSTARLERMARVVEGSKALLNPVGMATGMMLLEGGAVIMTFPGVPAEMKAMFDKYAVPIIEGETASKLVARTVTARMVFMDFFPMYRRMLSDHPDVYIKNVATPPEDAEERRKVKDIRVHIVVKGATSEESEKRIETVLREFKSRIEALQGELILDD